MNFRNGALLALVAAGSAGCIRDPYVYSDDVDLVFDFVELLVPFAAEDDFLNSPYVVGSRFQLGVMSERNRSLETWTLVVDDQDVLTVESDLVFGVDDWNALSFDVYAASPGETEVFLIDDDGDVRDTEVIEVRVPTRAELHHAGPLFVPHPQLDSLTPEPVIAAGGMATFKVEYFDGDRLLHGNGGLVASSDASVEVTQEETWFFEDRDWVHLTPSAVGEYELALTVGGYEVPGVPFEAVDPAVVDRVAIFGTSEAEAEDGDWMALYAQAYDAQDREIYGVEYTWDVDGVEQPGLGDLYRYEFLSTETRTIAANRGDLRAEIEVHASENGFVDSTNNVGCSTTGGVGGVAALGGLLALIGRRQARK